MSIGLKANADGSGAVQIGGTDAVSISAALGITFATGVDGDFKMNSGYGSIATAFGCRAWVNFNGTGVVAIRASGNVSSITDNGVGDYTVNFATAMPDRDYAASGVCGNENNFIGLATDGFVPTASAIRLSVHDAANMPQDSAFVNFVTHR